MKCNDIYKIVLIPEIIIHGMNKPPFTFQVMKDQNILVQAEIETLHLIRVVALVDFIFIVWLRNNL